MRLGAALAARLVAEERLDDLRVADDRSLREPDFARLAAAFFGLVRALAGIGAAQIEKLVPQPQEAVALGLLT